MILLVICKSYYVEDTIVFIIQGNKIIILLSVSIGILEIITFRSYIRFILFSY